MQRGASSNDLSFFPTSYADASGLEAGRFYEDPAAGSAASYAAAGGGPAVMLVPGGGSADGYMNAYGPAGMMVGGGGGGGGGIFGLGGGGGGSGGTGYEAEPPLLEELGINFHHIRVKTMTVLNPIPRTLDEAVIGDRDLAGPLVFALTLGAFLLLRGRVHFRYIYTIGVCACLGMYLLLNLLADRGIDIYQSASILGYCLLPMVALAGSALFVTMDTLTGYLLTAAAVAWCTHTASLMFVTALQLKHQRLLVAYPIALLYLCFALLTVF